MENVAKKNDTDVSELKPARQPRKFEGLDLEMDVIRKIGHQLERLPGGRGAVGRVLQFVAEASAAPKQAELFE